jgi:hypothetical protein
MRYELDDAEYGIVALEQGRGVDFGPTTDSANRSTGVQQ